MDVSHFSSRGMDDSLMTDFPYGFDPTMSLQQMAEALREVQEQEDDDERD